MQNGAGVRNNNPKEQEQDLWNAKKEQNGAGISNNEPKE